VSLSRSGGVLAANLQIGADLTSCGPLQANSKISCPGVKLHGSGFIVTNEEASQLGLGTIAGIEQRIKGYRNGKDLTNRPRDVRVIDLFSLTEEATRDQHPTLYQHVLVHVKPERDQNNRDTYRKNWWVFGEPRRDFRPALDGLPRYIATVETSKHRFFTFLDRGILPDNKLIAIAIDDAFALGVLSSSIHITWSLAGGSWLGVGNDSVYVKTRCFDPFPFPILEEGELKQRIRDLGERLDAHRKHQQELHPGLTLTGIYNVLEKLHSGISLDAKDKTIHDKGLVSMLKQIHDDLDAAVLEAYGWPDLASAIPPADTLARGGPDAEALEQNILSRLVALNHERAAEEKRGLIRWLRPDFQAPGTATAQQVDIGLGDDTTTPDTAAPIILDWPAELPAQVVAIRKLLPTVGQDAEILATCFGRKSKKRVDQVAAILDTLKTLGLII
jgi:hypothetical protein